MRKCKHKCATHLGHTTPQAYQTSGCGGGGQGLLNPKGWKTTDSKPAI